MIEAEISLSQAQDNKEAYPTVTLEELFPDDFPERPLLNTLPDILLEVPVELLVAAGIPLDEGKWQDAHITGMRFRVDAERPEMKQQRHVHVAAVKNQNTKAKQASWNVDGSRHDKKTFDAKLGGQKAYQDVARQALGLGDDILLEAVESNKPATILTSLFESLSEPAGDIIHLRASRKRQLKPFSEFLACSGSSGN